MSIVEAAVIRLPRDEHVNGDAPSSDRTWEPRSSTPNGPHPLSPSKPQPSPLLFAEDEASLIGSRPVAQPARPTDPPAETKPEDLVPSTTTPPRIQLPLQPPRSAWKNMPGFEALDESWAESSRQSEASKGVIAISKPSPKQPPPTAGEVLRDSTQRIVSNAQDDFFDARASALASSTQAADGPSNTENNGPRKTWIENKGGKRAIQSHLKPHARPNIPSLTSLTDSEAILKPGPSTSVMRKRSQDVRATARELEEGVSSAPESGSTSALAASARFDDALESLQQEGSTGERRIRSRASSSSSSSSGSGCKQGGRAERPPSIEAQPKPPAEKVSNESTDSGSNAAGVTASEGAEATFIHHSDVSDLPPVLRPAWQKGVAGAIDPRTPGKKGKGLTSIGGDMFTPLKLQTMFKTPTPPSQPPTTQLAVPEAGPSTKPLSRSISPQMSSAVSVRSNDTDALKEPHLSRSAAFTFRSPLTSAHSSPFAHLATPKSAAKKRGLSAEAYAHIGQTPPRSPGSLQYQQRSLPLRLFRFGESPKERKNLHTKPLTEDVEGTAAEAISEEEAIRLFRERVQELTALKQAELQSHHNVSPAPPLLRSPERKRIRLAGSVRRSAGTLPEDDGAATQVAAPQTLLPPVSTTEVDAESPRKLFRKYSAAEQVDKEIEAEKRADHRLRVSHYADDERRREEEVVALEERIRLRRERRDGLVRPSTEMPEPVSLGNIAKPPKIALVDEYGNNETIPQGLSRTYSATLIQSSRPRISRTQSAETASDSIRMEEPIRRYASARGRGRASGSFGASGLTRVGQSIASSTLTEELTQATTSAHVAIKRAVEPIQEVSNETLPSPPAQPHGGVMNAAHLRVQKGQSGENSGNSDSSDPFKDIESFGSSSPKDSPAPTSQPLPITTQQSKPIQATPAQSRSSKSRPSGGTPPILRPTYAMTPSPNAVPSRGSALRHEVVPSEDGDSTTQSDISLVAQASGLDEVAEQIPLELRPPASDKLTLAATTPLRKGGSSSALSTPQPPRSILKGGSTEATPISTRLLQPPRSISFADGKTTGKMFSTSPLKDINDPWEDPDATPKARLGRGGAQQMTFPKAKGLPTSRAARIEELLRQVAALAMEEETTDAKLTTNRVRQYEEEETEDSWQAPSPTSRFSQPQSHIDSPFDGSRRSLASNRGDGIVGGRSVWNFDDSAVDKTFLTHASFDVAHDRMLEVITDVAPWVPDWEVLKTIDLSSRKLDSVVRLKEFLPNLEEVALDDNAISYFTGLPSTVKVLTVSFNQIPSIASFGHLMHLETLDISHNEMDDLSSLECLHHLRHLKADYNGIKVLNGISNLEHLHTISLQGNRLTVLDLEKSPWKKLSALDVSHNRLVSIRGLATCRHLKTLNATSNDLPRIDMSPKMPKLKVLRVSSNPRLSELNVSPAKELHTLYADFCSLEHIDHLESLSKLENLSVRQQNTERGGFVWPGDEVKDTRRLFMSGNAFSQGLMTYCTSLPPRSSSHFTRIAYLELSACQLDYLPSDFARLFPTLHHLNLDHNLFSKLPKGCFSGLKDLKRLSMVGCRLGKTRNILEALEGCEALTVLDTRMNPLTLGLYPPLLITSNGTGHSHHHQAGPSHRSGQASTSPAHLAPIPNFQIVRPDTAIDEARRAVERDAEEQMEGWEKSFFHKRHPLPQTNGGDDDSDLTLKPIPAHKAKVTGSLHTKPTTLATTYALSDERFSRTLPKTFSVKRLLHRGTLGMVCPRLTWLDGLHLDDEQVLQADAWLKSRET